MIDHMYNAAYPANSAYWVQGLIDKRFKVGDQTLWSMVYGAGNYNNSRRFFFNLIRRHLNMICGYQRKNRKSTITQPIQKDTDPIADDYNKLLKWLENRDGFQEYFSQSFEGSTDVGLNLLHLYPDYTNDPISGDLMTDSVGFSNFLIDPWFRKMDLSDCNFIWRRRWVSKTTAQSLLPSKADEIEKLNPHGVKDGRFPVQAELINIDITKLLSYDEFHYRTTRKAKVVTDPVSGESFIWDDDDDEGMEELKEIMRFQPWLKVSDREVPTVKLVILINDIPMYHGPNLLGIDEYPFVPTICYHEPDIPTYPWRITGVIRNLRDPQYLYNSRIVIMEDILRSQINSGWIYPVDVLTDPKALRQTGQGYLVPLKAGSKPQDIQRIDAPNIPSSMIELANILSTDITKISGVNEELLGAATDDKAGILSMLRQSAGLTTLQGIFDRADYSQRLYGEIRLKAALKNFSKGKMRNILGHDPLPQFWRLNTLKYSVAVEEGTYSTTQRQTELQQLLYFKELGIPIADATILKKAFISNKEEVLNDMQAQQEQAQAAQSQQAQEQAKKDNADIMVKYAKAKSELALEKERIASSQEKVAKLNEIEAASEQKQMKADLDLVKIMMELEDMDFQSMQNAFNTAQSLRKAQEQTQLGGVL